MIDKWISVEDQVPENDEEVWVFNNKDEGCVTIGYRNEYGWVDVYGDFDGMRDPFLYYVTHWRPLIRPEPPEKE